MAVEVVAPLSLTFGTPQWLRASLNVYGNSIVGADRDCSLAAEVGPELRRYCAERGIEWSTFISEHLPNRPVDFCSYVERGVEILRRRGVSGPISRDEAHAAAVAEMAAGAVPLAEPKPPPPGPGRGKRDKAGSVTTCFPDSDAKQERGSAYLTARIARDAPEVLERMKAGEFSSVRQAAIAAGIVDTRKQLEQQATRAVRRIDDREALDRISAAIAQRYVELDERSRT